MRPGPFHRGVGVLAVVLAAMSCVGTVSASSPDDPGLTIVTVPALPGTIFEFDGRTFVTDETGSVRVPDAGQLQGLANRLSYQGFEGDPTVGVVFTRFAGAYNANHTRRVEAVFETTRAVSFSFVDLDGRPVESERVTTMTLKNSMGVLFEIDTFMFDTAIVLPSQRAVQSFDGYVAKDIYYTVQDVVIDGSNTVNRSQQKFFPAEVTTVEVETQFYHVTISVTDALFGFTNGAAALVRWPDGHETRNEVVDGVTTLYLPRGDYEMRVDGPGLETWRPVSVSRDQDIELELFSYVDIGLLATSTMAIAIVLVVIGRRRHHARHRETGFFTDAPPQVPTQGGDADAEPAEPIEVGRT